MNFRGFAALPSNVTAERPHSYVMETCVKRTMTSYWSPVDRTFVSGESVRVTSVAPYFFYLLIFGSVNYTPAMMVNITADRRHGGGPWTFSFLFFSVRVLLFIC